MISGPPFPSIYRRRLPSVSRAPRRHISSRKKSLCRLHFYLPTALSRRPQVPTERKCMSHVRRPRDNRPLTPHKSRTCMLLRILLDHQSPPKFSVHSCINKFIFCIFSFPPAVLIFGARKLKFMLSFQRRNDHL